ncbi:glutamate 5-kinase [Ceraceosorus bombacis]|uniref:Glutamate 5-kinase n=1 Tax=Ceraceosorus bombacis TaxID=401625 RepID=A0A0P1BAA1_9BASI|nr:glutamate 5-kinase [Ceraceosorus bombacis]
MSSRPPIHGAATTASLVSATLGRESSSSNKAQHDAAASTSTASAANPPRGKRIVIKLGTSSILSSLTNQPKLSVLSSIVETCAALRKDGHSVVIVCSGAIGMGRLRMGLNEKPKSVGERQALAALGQVRLIALWDSLFAQVGISVAQVLLTRNDLGDRPRFENAKTTLSTLLSLPFSSIPIINENDTVSVSELRFGDNDTLSAIAAGIVDADYLFLCTDVDGLYTGNPNSNPNARRLGVVRNVALARKAVSVDTPGSNFGTGGMQTKLIAAELATAAGVATVILNGNQPTNILSVVARGLPALDADQRLPNSDQGMVSSISSLLDAEELSKVGYPPILDPPHTLFLPTSEPLAQRKWSLLHALHPAGTLVIDEGAFARISKPESGGRLLPAGVVGVEGTWERMQAVRIVLRRHRIASSAEATGTNVERDALHHSQAIQESMSAAALARRGLTTFIKSSDGSGATTPIHLAGEDQHAHLAEPVLTRDAPSELDWELIEVGRGLANYSSIESERIKGIKSSQISTVLGYADSSYIVDQLALMPTEGAPSAHRSATKGRG